jgi:hypothetical protein
LYEWDEHSNCMTPSLMTLDAAEEDSVHLLRSQYAACYTNKSSQRRQSVVIWTHPTAARLREVVSCCHGGVWTNQGCRLRHVRIVYPFTQLQPSKSPMSPSKNSALVESNVRIYRDLDRQGGRDTGYRVLEGVSRSKNLMIFSGSGISVEAGLPVS